MKIVDITDIEELILCKHEIDTILIEHEDIEEKMTLNDFMQTYVNLNNTTYICNDEMTAFSYIDVYGSKFLLVSEKKEESINSIKKILNAINYDFSNLKRISNREILENIESSSLILYNGKYYDGNI